MLSLVCLALLTSDAPRLEPAVSLRPVAVSEAQILVDVRALEAKRPGSGPGIALMVIGSIGTVVSGVTFFPGTDEALRYGSAGAVASLGLFLAGLWWLLVSDTERHLLDLELHSLRSELTNLRTARSRAARMVPPPPPPVGP